MYSVRIHIDDLPPALMRPWLGPRLILGPSLKTSLVFPLPQGEVQNSWLGIGGLASHLLFLFLPTPPSSLCQTPYPDARGSSAQEAVMQHGCEVGSLAADGLRVPT